MRKRIIIGGIVVAVLFFAWFADNRHGGALETGGTYPESGAPMVGTDVYFMTFGLTNRSGGPLTVVTIDSDVITDGLEFVEARIYTWDDFIGGVPATWTPGDGGLWTPETVASVPAIGYRISGHRGLDGKVMFAHFRVTTGRRPLTASGLRVTYRHGFREHMQTVPGVYSLTKPGSAG
ncbi:hypothetical protein OG555_08325 [Kribbella sp. NBC_01484]|uniref:hypothetical protein n=1 Tax=Kribbella sp. NBC_01484 TaxID=2903579 RepID=UPI002E351E53|nr:hypothetical protein [Kribbella sp. NBC_01484]